MTERAHEKHNRIAAEIGQRIAREFEPADRLIVLESLLAGVIGTIKFKQPKMQGVDWALDLICKSARTRIADMTTAKEPT